MANRVREERLRRGLGQAELADRAGVTRQSIGAIEAGRHSPSVDAALRIAGALGVAVEALFADPEQTADVAVGVGASTGTAVVVGRVGTQRVYAPVRNLLAGSESWAVADGFIGDEGVEVFGGVDESGLVIGGCDPLLGLVADLLATRRGPRVVPVHLSTGSAVAALSKGVVHGVVVHGPLGSLPSPPIEVRRWRFASWRVGVASPLRREVSSVEQLADRRIRTAQREQGAGTQRALERALAAVGSSGLPGPRVDGHLDAARHVVAGLPAGITMEAAASAFGLSFLPLETHQSELWIDARYVEHRGAVAVISMLCDSALANRATRLPGYDVAQMGVEVLAS
jgi:DNA-binding XRE family transcriptional regulator